MMKLTTIKPLPGGRYRLSFDDETDLTVEESVIGDCGLYRDMELDDTAMEDLLRTAQRASARARAVRIVGATSVSEQDLLRRLRQKGERADDAEEAVAWLADMGVLDDEALAVRIAQRAAAKGYGEYRIRQELYRKGIPKEYWDDALEDIGPGDDAVDSFLQKRLRGELPDRKEKQRVIDALRRRGFSWEEIRAGLQRYEEEVEEYE